MTLKKWFDLGRYWWEVVDIAVFRKREPTANLRFSQSNGIASFATAY
ncbi:MAG: hypothetical protein K2I29_06175 [Clostridia bacterium]|nr:hypothetical protein [Clostridia bacterium]